MTPNQQCQSTEGRHVMLWHALTGVVAELDDDGRQRRVSVELDVPAQRQRPTADAVEQDAGRRVGRLDHGELDSRRVAAVRVLRRAHVQTAVVAPRRVDRQTRPHRTAVCRRRRARRRLEVERLQPAACKHRLTTGVTRRTSTRRFAANIQQIRGMGWLPCL